MTGKQLETMGNGRRTLGAISTLAAGALICWLLSVYSVSLLTLLAGYGVWRHSATVCLLVIPLWTFLAQDVRSGASFLQGLAAVMVTAVFLGACYWLAGSFIDQSWDGMAYHQQAILQMVQGWRDFPARLDPSVMYHQQLDHYPKAVWIIAASIYQAGTSMESAKLLQFVFLACAFLMLFGALVRIPRFPLWMAVPVALAAAFNPVTIYQSLSFYVDGQLASMLVTAVGLLLLILLESRRQYLWLLIAIVILTINIKQTGVVFIGFLLFALVILIFRYRREQFTSTLLAAMIGVIVGFTLFGYSPYVTNTVNFGNPFYPILGRGDTDFEKGHRPPGFDERSGVDRLLRSTLSAPTLAVDAPEALHAPFTLTQDANIRTFSGADIRLGGWGVLFSGALTLAVLALPLLLFVPGPTRTAGLVILGALVASVLVNPESWWARFAPQWYLVALVPAAMLQLARRLSARFVGLVITLVLLVNSGLVAYAYFPKQKADTADLQEYLGLVKGTDMPIIVYFGAFPSNSVRLKEAGIPFQAVTQTEHLPCRAPHEIFAYEGLFCVKGER
jgi:hypothetical protein